MMQSTLILGGWCLEICSQESLDIQALQISEAASGVSGAPECWNVVVYRSNYIWSEISIGEIKLWKNSLTRCMKLCQNGRQTNKLYVHVSQHLTYLSFFYQSDGITNENHVFICTRNQSLTWLGISFAYKGSLQVIAIFMAFHTRRVKIKALNDSKEITAIIYFNSIILVLLVVTEFALQHYHDVYAALFGLALLIEASLFLGILFIPKVNTQCTCICSPLYLQVVIHSEEK